jgi:hypothetical protein
MKWSTLVVFLAFGLTACGTGSSAESPTPPAVSFPPTTHAPQSQSAPHIADALTGFGATRGGFAASHEADTDPRAAPGCCFLPKVQNSGSGDQDAYAPVLYGDGYVDDESINFDAGTPQAEALDTVGRELPADSRLVRQRKARVCNSYLFISRALKRNAPGIGSYISVSLYGTATGAYNPEDVEQAILVAEGNMIGRC